MVNPGNSASNVMSLQVNAPVTAGAPVISSATASSYLLVINGSGFQSGLSLSFTYPGGTFTEGSGYIFSLSSTQVVAYLSPATATGPRTVTVTNSGGQKSNTATIQ